MREELVATRGRRRAARALDAEIEARGQEALRLAQALSRARAAAAGAFAGAVRRELDGLAMGRCRLEVALPPPAEGVEVGRRLLGAAGAERAES